MVLIDGEQHRIEVDERDGVVDVDRVSLLADALIGPHTQRAHDHDDDADDAKGRQQLRLCF
jgi:hypothetical protein